MACHFLNKKTGLGPTNKFDTTIHIISPPCFVNIPVHFLKHIFKFMGNILSFIIYQVEKYKQYENASVIKSQIHDEYRVLLNRIDLLNLRDLECAILEIINRKFTVIKPLVIQQIDQIVPYLKSNIVLKESTLEIIKNHVRNINNDLLSSHVIGNYNYVTQLIANYNFSSQHKLYATNHIEQWWIEKDEV